MALTKVSPSLFQVSNNITSVTVGGSANTISLTFDSNGVITGASNNAVSVANTAITGNIISSQIASVSGSVITANTVANSAIQTGAIESYMRANTLDFGMRNRIINGAMRIDQRNNGAANTPVNNGYTLDRWKFGLTQASKFTAQQDSSANTVAGFTSSMKITSSSAYSVTSTDTFFFDQCIEGNNVSDLRWGTASARPVTLSFWVRSSLTGQFGGALRNSAADRAYPFSYTIVAANTWEQKFITVAGDTSGTWLTTNGTGIEIVWNLGSVSSYLATAGAWTAGNIIGATGDTSVVGTNGATWYITGVQLEEGSTATPFEYRQYTTELALCQRYFWRQTGGYGIPALGAGFANQSTTARICIQNPVEMRAAMSYSYSGNLYLLASNASGLAVTSIGSIYAGLLSSMVEFGVSAGLVSGNGTLLCADNAATNYIQASAEL